MSEIKAVYPLLEGISIGQKICERAGVSCYAAMNTDTGEKFILKHISIPESQVQVEALILTGSCADERAAKAYYSSVVDDLREDLSILAKVAESKCFIPYVGYQVSEKEAGVGYDAYLLGTYHSSLAAYARRNAFTHLHAVNLAMDLCAALSACRKAGYLYLDLKPENIYILNRTQHVIGDIGFVALDALAYASFPDKYASLYSAPELQDIFASINTTVDTYALGLVLYQIYNGGRLPFEDEGDPEAAHDRRLKGEALPAPIYADYEMAEILLKACAFKPEERWQTPEEMGQALISYMQRNDVTDAIIAPPIITDLPLDPNMLNEDSDVPAGEPDTSGEASAEPDEYAQVANMSLEDLLAGVTLQQDEEESAAPASADEPAAPVPAEESAREPEIAEDLSAILETQDDTVPDEADVDLNTAPADDDLADILAQADNLIQHAEEVAQAEEAERKKAEEEVRAKEAAEKAAKEEAEAQARAEQEAKEKEEAEAKAREKKEQSKAKRKRWISLLVIVLILALLGGGGYYYYRNYYCLYISGMEITDSSQDFFSVAVTTDSDPSLLTIRCTDTYGNTQDKLLSGGSVTFTDLAPDTQYVVTAMANGFHKLVGSSIQVSYATNPTTDVSSFTVIAGQEDGSVTLNLTVSGPEPEEWIVAYAAEDEAQQVQAFTGHMVTITGLTVGKTYSFVLQPIGDVVITGTTTLEYTVTEIITAQNLQISSYTGPTLTVTWESPEVPVSSWTVRCYNDSGYDSTQDVTDCTATFEGLDSTTPYTVEVIAYGMTLGTHVYVSENPVIINTTTCTPVDGDPTRMNVQWSFTGTEPEGGWLLIYSFGSGENATEAAQTDTNSVSLSNLIPHTTYNFRLQTATGLTVFDGEFTASTPAAYDFSAYGITGYNIYMAMFPTPDVENWTFDNVNVGTYTTAFRADQPIAFVLGITSDYRTSDDNVTTLCVVRDANGSAVDYYIGTEQWHAMWTENMYLGELERTPQAPGNYTLEIYFNGALVKNMAFTITA